MTAVPNKVDCTDEVVCECTEVSTLEVYTALVPLGEGADVSCEYAELTSFMLNAYAEVSSLHIVGLSTLCACEHGKATNAEHCDDGTTSEVEADD